MFSPWRYLTIAWIEAQVDEITTARKLKKSGYDVLATEVQFAVISLLDAHFPEKDFYELERKSWGHVVMVGRIDHIWKSPIWDWGTGLLLSANSPGNWSLHNNFNISPDAKNIKD